MFSLKHLIHYSGRQAVGKKNWFSEFLALVKRVFWQVYNQKLSNIQEDITKTQQKFQVFAKCRGHHDNFWYWPLEKECVRVKKVCQKFFVHMFSECTYVFGIENSAWIHRQKWSCRSQARIKEEGW